MCGESGRGRNGTVHRYYKCVSVKKKRTDCKKKAVKKDWIENLVISQTMKLVNDEETVKAITAMLLDMQERENTNLPLLTEQLKETQRGIDSLRFDMATGFCNLGNAINSQTRDIIDNQNANYRSLMDFLVQEKLSTKDARIAELSNQLSQSNQNAVIRAAIDASTAEIIRRTGNECPVPAYVVPNPNCCYGNPLGVGYGGYGGYGGYNNGGGCGCGC